MSETYFLGSSTAQGFRTTFDNVIKDEGIFTYILKGGAGTGKSSLMKKAANEFENYEHVIPILLTLLFLPSRELQLLTERLLMSSIR